MQLNINKFNILNVLKNNLFNNYILNSNNLEKSDYERDLGVLVSSDFRSEIQWMYLLVRSYKESS